MKSKNEIIDAIVKDIKAIASIYPTAFDLYDEPTLRLAQRIYSTIEKNIETKQVWIDIESGKFSNSWLKSKDDVTQDEILMKVHNSESPWKLIEYTCPIDDFELNNNMQLK